LVRKPELFAANEADAEAEGQASAAEEGAEIGGVDIIDDGVGILADEDVDGFDADAAEVLRTAEAEFFLRGWRTAGMAGMWSEESFRFAGCSREFRYRRGTMQFNEESKPAYVKIELG